LEGNKNMGSYKMSYGIPVLKKIHNPTKIQVQQALVIALTEVDSFVFCS